ncbi:MAG: helix-turn-helix domain-containing protein, partial [Chloroflexota bacterium]|nr:helix-turn-helix domain-containing protein [Chloroflexota bacterium]
LHILERRIRHGASVWLFDDLPFARIDEIAAESLTITLRALLRRQPSRPHELRPMHAPDEPDRAPAPSAPSEAPLPGRDVLRETLIAVARSNGRVATAARELGVHRNTVLYRLRRATVELGVDPRRPADALAILREADEPGR